MIEKVTTYYSVRFRRQFTDNAEMRLKAPGMKLLNDLPGDLIWNAMRCHFTSSGEEKWRLGKHNSETFKVTESQWDTIVREWVVAVRVSAYYDLETKFPSIKNKDILLTVKFHQAKRDRPILTYAAQVNWMTDECFFFGARISRASP